MENRPNNPYAELERIFHEPSRLAIMSNLCGAVEGMTFTELKQACDLTDGNLNSHLKVLGEQNAVKIKKEFVGAKPRTTVFLTGSGRKSFVRYLDALEDVLKAAAKKARANKTAEKTRLPKGARVKPSEA